MYTDKVNESVTTVRYNPVRFFLLALSAHPILTVSPHRLQYKEKKKNLLSHDFRKLSNKCGSQPTNFALDSC